MKSRPRLTVRALDIVVSMAEYVGRLILAGLHTGDARKGVRYWAIQIIMIMVFIAMLALMSYYRLTHWD